MTADYYADIYKKYATFMSAWGNKEGLYRIASGANSADYNWTETLMKKIPHSLMKGVALHHYAVIDWNAKGPSTKFSEEQYFKTMKSGWFMNELIDKHSAIMDKYDPEGRIDLIVDEWGGWYEVEPGTNPGFLYQQNTMRDAMLAGMTLNIFNNHAKRVKMANLAQAVNVLQSVILTRGNQIILTPTYHVMEMYKVHQDARQIPLEISTDSFTFAGDSIPALSASASKDEMGKIHVSLVNIDPTNNKKISIGLGGIKASNVEGRILKSQNLRDYNTFEKPETIVPALYKEAKLRDGTIEVDIPAFSVIVLELT